MPFSEKRKTIALLRARHRCQACGCDVYSFPGEEPKYEIHSGSTLHVVEDESDTNFFVVTSAPTGHRQMQRRRLPARMFLAYALGQPDDAYCLCIPCHQEIHRKADELMVTFGKREVRNVLIDLMQSLTLEYVSLGGRWASDL